MLEPKVRNVTSANPEIVGVAAMPSGVRIEPSAVSEFTSRVTPMVANMSVSQETTGSPLNSIVSEEINLTRTRLEELATKNASPEQLSAIVKAGQARMNLRMLESGIDKKDWSAAGAIFKDSVSSDEYISVENRGSFAIRTNLINNTTNIITYGQAEAVDAMEGKIYETFLPYQLKAIEEGTVDVATAEKWYKNAGDVIQNQTLLSQKLAVVKQRNELFEANEQAKDNNLNELKKDYDFNQRTAFVSFVDLLKESVSKGTMQPADAEARIEEWFADLSADTQMRELNIDPAKYTGDFRLLKDSAVSIITNADPRKEWDREVAGKELLWRETTVDIRNELPNAMKYNTVMSESAQQIAMTYFYRKSFGDKIPAMLYGEIANAADYTRREVFGPVYNRAIDEAIDVPIESSATAEAWMITRNAFAALNTKELNTEHLMTVEAAMEMYRDLKKLPSYSNLPKKYKDQLDTERQKIINTFSKDKKLSKALKEYTSD